MNNNELISIIVPIYNTESYLKECIESILCQEYQNFELILIDDGSTDGSYDICLDYEKKDSRIRVFHNCNHGVSYTRNQGIDVSKGSYICFVDSDDKVLPNYLTFLYQTIKENEANVVFCGHQLLYENRLVKKRIKVTAGIYSFEDLSYRAIDDGSLSGILFGSVWGSLYKSDIFHNDGVRFNEAVKKNEDGLFNLQVLPNTPKVVVVDFPGYVYRKRKVALSKYDNSVVSEELIEVSKIIERECVLYKELDKQLKCRMLFIIFWDLISMKNLDIPFGKIINCMKEYVNKSDFYEMYHCLNFKTMNKYKKLLIRLIYYKQYVLFMILVKYIKPILERYLSH